MGGAQERESAMKSLKSALVVVGALAFAWLSMELAFKPFLERARDAIEKSNPARDPDDDESDAPKRNSEEDTSEN